MRPCVTGVVLKWNTMVMFPFCKAKASAGMPFTVKSVDWTVAGSTGSLTLTMKSVGAVPVITPPQAGLVTWQGIEVAVAVGVGVGVVPAWTSNEPLSIRPPLTRSNPGPRWS